MYASDQLAYCFPQCSVLHHHNQHLTWHLLLTFNEKNKQATKYHDRFVQNAFPDHSLRKENYPNCELYCQRFWTRQRQAALREITVLNRFLKFLCWVLRYVEEIKEYADRSLLSLSLWSLSQFSSLPKTIIWLLFAHVEETKQCKWKTIQTNWIISLDLSLF